MAFSLESFLNTSIYEQSASVPSLITDLEDIAKIDNKWKIKIAKNDKKIINYSGAFFGAVFLFIFAIILMIVSSSVFITLLGIILLLLAIGIGVTAIFALIKTSDITHKDLSSYRHEFTYKNLPSYRNELTKNLIHMLNRDIDNTTNIDLHLSLQHIERDEFKIARESHPSKPEWNIDFYQHEWLKIGGIFRDKSRFYLSINESSKKKSGNQRSKSGKIKFKSKIKANSSLINLSLHFPRKKYGAIQVLKEEASNAIKLPDFCRLKNLKVSDKTINFVVRLSPDVVKNPEDIYKAISMMFLSIYQILNLAQVLSK